MSKRSLGQLTLDLVARTGGFVQGMDQAERSSAKWRKQVEKDMKVVKDRTVSTLKAGAAAATAFAVATAALTKKGLEAVESQARFAKSLGTTYDSVTQLRAAFGDSGIDDFEASMNRLNRRLGAAELGRGAAVNAVKELKLDLQELAQVDAAERVAIIADRIKDVATNSQTAARYAQDLGFEQREAASFFLQGGDAVRAYSEEIEALGLSLSDIDAQKVIDAQNAMGAFGDITTAVSQKLASNFAPLLKAASEELNNVAIEAGGVGVVVDDVFDRAVVGGIRTAASFRAVFNQLTSSLGDIWSGYQSLPPWAQEIGIVGALVGGKKGVLLVAAVAKAAEDTKVTAAWFAAYTQGDVGFFEWLSSGHGEAKDKLKELGYDVDEIKTKAEGPSIIGSLFGVDDKDNDEWADSMIARYRRIQEESRKSAEQAMKDWQEMRDGLRSGGGPNGGGAIDLVAQEITALERAAATWGMSANEVKLYDMTVQGATDAQLMHAQAVMRNIEAMEQQAEAAKKAIEDQKRINQEAQGIAESLLTEEERILASYERRRQIILDNTKITGEAQTELLRRLEEDRNEQLIEVNGSYWEKWLAGAEEALTSFDQLGGTVIESFQNQFGAAFESMIFDAQSVDEAIQGMMEGMLRSVVNAIGQMIAQWLAYQAVQLLVGKTTQASAVAQTTGNAYAGVMQAGINAFSSTAAIPIVGPLLAPAAMTTAIAATTPMAAAASTFAMMGMAHDGIDSIPKTGTWLLEKGERVTTADTSAKLDATLSRVNQNLEGGGGARVIINHAPPGTTVEERTGADGASEFVVDLRQGGPRSRAMESFYGLKRVGR